MGFATYFEFIIQIIIERGLMTHFSKLEWDILTLFPNPQYSNQLNYFHWNYISYRLSMSHTLFTVIVHMLLSSTNTSLQSRMGIITHLDIFYTLHLNYLYSMSLNTTHSTTIYYTTIKQFLFSPLHFSFTKP